MGGLSFLMGGLSFFSWADYRFSCADYRGRVAGHARVAGRGRVAGRFSGKDDFREFLALFSSKIRISSKTMLI